MVTYCDFLHLFRPKSKIFFVGIGGVSMSSLAFISKNAGLSVSGHDIADNSVTQRLKDSGIPVFGEFDESEFDGVELVVFTGAIKEDSPFIRYPKEKNIPIMKRGEFLGFLMKKFKNPIGIAGTHGKSTTTGMISSIFMAAKHDPTILIGAETDILPDRTFRVGQSEDFIFEACEYQDSFLSFFPKIAVILNVFHDHADYFPSINEVIDSFVKWADIASEGYAVINLDNEGAKSVAERTKTKIFTFSEKEEADVSAKNISGSFGAYSFDLFFKNEFQGRIDLKILGEHNVSNALAAASSAFLSGIPFEFIKEGLESYVGVKRRFEYRGMCKTRKVFDDYAHHPDEIEATLKSAKQMTDQPITVIFQSHTFSRTKAYFDNFISSLSLADEVIFADIYPARELPIPEIDAVHLAKSSKNGKYVGDFKKIAEYIKSENKEGILIVMGAGDIINLTPLILDK